MGDRTSTREGLDEDLLLPAASESRTQSSVETALQAQVAEPREVAEGVAFDLVVCMSLLWLMQPGGGETRALPANRSPRCRSTRFPYSETAGGSL